MDRRIKYTKRIIKETFFTLLEQKEINRITVSEICKIADINRATFYRYYLDVYDLLNKIENEFIEELKLNTNKDDYTINSFSRQLLEVFVKNKQLVKILFNSKNTINFLNEILEIAYYHCKKTWENSFPNITEQSIEYAAVFIFNGALGIINFWVQNNFDKDIDEISSLISNLSYNGIKKFIYEK